MIMAGLFLQMLYDIHLPAGSVTPYTEGLEHRQAQRMARAAFS